MIQPHQAQTIWTYSASTDVSLALFKIKQHLQYLDKGQASAIVCIHTTFSLDAPSAVVVDPIDEYLPSGVPLPLNLLAPLLLAPEFANSNLNLPSSRLEKMVPLVSNARSIVRSVKGMSNSVPITSALHISISRTVLSHYTYINVEVVIPADFPHDVELSSVACNTASMTTNPVTTNELPMVLSPGNQINFVFDMPSASSSDPAQIQILSSVKQSDTVKINMITKRTLAGIGMKKNEFNFEKTKHWSQARGNSRPTSLGPGPVQLSINDPPRQAALKISFSAPAQIIVGEVFQVDFFIVNNGKQKRRLAILGPSIDNANNASGGSRKFTRRATVHVDRSVSRGRRLVSNKTQTGGGVNHDGMAQAVLDQQVLYDQIHGKSYTQTKSNSASDNDLMKSNYKAQILTLDVDVKSGVLSPGACCEVSMRMRAMSAGIVTLEGMLVIDLDSRETCIFGEGWEGLCFERPQ